MSFKGKPMYTVVTIISILLLSIIVVFPLLWSTYLSFKPAHKMFIPGITFPIEITFDNYKSTLLNAQFMKSVFNGLLVSICTALVSIIVGSPAAYSLAFSKWNLKMKERYMYFMLLLRMATPIAFAIPIFLIYSKLGLVDTFIGLMISYLTFTLPLVVWLLWMYFLDIPDAILQSASIDGASVYKRFLHIAVPLCAPGIVAACILAFGACWNDFFYALVLTRYNVSTGSIAVMNFLKFSSYDWGGVTSACTILIIPSLPIAFFMQKYLAHGITAGAIKE